MNEGFRYRDLATGSFITRDPLGFVDGPNMYAYVVQNPWSKFDPEGLWLEDLVIGIPSLIMGAKSCYDNVSAGNYGSAAIDAVGMVADAGAIALPGVPGGVGIGIKATRATIAAAQKVDKVAALVQGVEATVDAAESGDVVGAVKSGASVAMGAKASLPGGKSANVVQAETKALAKGGTYTLNDADGNVVRTGRTNDLARRESEHGKKHPGLDFKPDVRTDDYAEQRGREDKLYKTAS